MPRSPWTGASIAFFALTLLGCADAPSSGVACDSAADCAALDDGDPCNGTLACTFGRCAFDPSSVVTCDASGDTACSQNRCDRADGTCKATAAPDGAPCDDGEPCSLGDTCAAGVCKAGTLSTCECQADSDCADDGDLCNGTPRCDLSLFPYRCKVDPATVVTCKDDDDPCLQAACDPKTGKCAQTKTCVCTSDSDCVDDDDDACTGVPYCDKSGGATEGTCKTNPATVVSCSNKADTACAKNTCLPATGACTLVPVKEGTACDDGEACTANDTCVGGTCVGGKDTCACTKDSDCKDQEDGDLCNGTLYCDLKSGKCLLNNATKVVCPTAADTECSKNVCLPKTGKCAALARKDVVLLGCVKVDLGGLVGEQCVYKPATAPQTGVFPCDDGNACTESDVCAGKVCQAGKTVCECKQDSDCAGKDDGDLCNGVQFCDKTTGTCKANPGSVIYCDKAKDSACLKAQCDPKTGKCGLQPVKAGGACDDGDGCTLSDACDGKGGCAGKAKSCDDGDACTADSCTAKGCVHVAKVCDDGNVCTDEACVPKTGQCQTPTPRKGGSPCDADGSACTPADGCDGKGACVAGPAVQCKQPSDPCKVAVCVAKGATGFACTETLKGDGAPCDKPGACTVGATCSKGVCTPGSDDTLYAERLVGAKDGFTRLRAVVPLGGGDLIIAGQRRAKASAPASANVGFVARTDVLGAKERWQVAIAGQTADADTSVEAAAGVGGGVVVAAAVRDQAAKTAVDIVRLDGAGKTLWTRRLGPTLATGAWGWLGKSILPKDLAVAPLGIAAGADGTVAVLLHEPRSRISNGKLVPVDAARVQFLSPTGAPGASRIEVDQLDDQYYWNTVIGGDVVFIGGDTVAASVQLSSDDGGPQAYQRGLAYEIRADGKRLARHGHAWGKKAGTRWLHRDHKGRLVQVSSSDLADPKVASLMVRAGSPSQAQDATYTTSLGFRPDRLAPSLHGPYALVGKSLTGDTVHAALLDHRGNQRWAATVGGAGTPVADAAIAADDTLVVVGDKLGPAGARQGRISRRSPWGDTSCAGAGPCNAKPWAECDDAKVCTYDDCDASLGCVHSVGVTQNCDPSNGCSASATCVSGVCTPSQYGVIHYAYAGWGQSMTTALSRGRVFPPMPIIPTPGLDDPDLAWLVPQFDSSARLGFGEFTSELVMATGYTLDWLKKQGVSQDLWIRPLQTPIQGWSRYLLTGTRKTAKGLQAWFHAITSANPQTRVGCDTGSCSSQARDLIQGVDKRLWWVQRQTSGGQVSLVVRWGNVLSAPAGTLQVPLGQSAATHDYVDGGARSDGGLTLLLRTPGAGGRDAEVRALDHKGAPLYVAKVGTQRDDAPSAVAAALDGGAFVVGTSAVSTQLFSGWVARVSGKGKVLWSQTPSGFDSRQLTSVLVDGGRVLVAGSQGLGKQMQSFVGALSWGGQWQHERTYGEPFEPGTALLQLPDGRVIVTTREREFFTPFGSTQTKILDVVAITRLDPWLHTDCVSAGGCGGKVAKDCDDGNPCTIDLCDAKAGCTHAKASGAPCGTGKVCAAGTCVAGG